MDREKQLKQILNEINNLSIMYNHKIVGFINNFSDKQLEKYNKIKENSTHLTSDDINNLYFEHFNTYDKKSTYLFNPIIQFIMDRPENKNLKNDIIEHITTKADYNIYAQDILLECLKGYHFITPENIKNIFTYLNNAPCSLEDEIVEFLNKNKSVIPVGYLRNIAEYYLSLPIEEKRYECGPVLSFCLKHCKSKKLMNKVLDKNKEKYRNILIQNKYIPNDIKQRLYEDGVNPFCIRLNDMPKDIADAMYDSILESFFDIGITSKNKSEFNKKSDNDSKTIKMAYKNAKDKIYEMIISNQLTIAQEYDLFLRFKSLDLTSQDEILTTLLQNTKAFAVLIESQSLKNNFSRTVALYNPYMPDKILNRKLERIAKKLKVQKELPKYRKMPKSEKDFVTALLEKDRITLPVEIYQKMLTLNLYSQELICAGMHTPVEILDKIIKNNKSHPDNLYAITATVSRINKELQNTIYSGKLSFEILTEYYKALSSEKIDYISLELAQQYKENTEIKEIINNINKILKKIKPEITNVAEKNVYNNLITLTEKIQNNILAIDGDISKCSKKILINILEDELYKINNHNSRYFYDNVDNIILKFQNIISKIKEFDKVIPINSREI